MDSLSPSGIEWHHIHLFFQEKEGLWERLVCMTKYLIIFISAKQYFRKITGEELHTYFKEVECILN